MKYASEHGANDGELLLRKQAQDGVTVALAYVGVASGK